MTVRVVLCAVCGQPFYTIGWDKPNPENPDDRTHPECTERYWETPGTVDPDEGDR